MKAYTNNFCLYMPNGSKQGSKPVSDIAKKISEYKNRKLR